MPKLDLVKEIREFKTQLAYAKRVGFFFGAGTSCALGIPNIAQLTVDVRNVLPAAERAQFEAIENDLAGGARPPNIEDVLNHVRRIRELTDDKADREYRGISGESAHALDKHICKQIHAAITIAEEKADLTVPKRFFSWLNILDRQYTKEIFTTNYDLVIERSLEAGRIPYFDGFVGSYEPFFWQESVERCASPNDVTSNWTRLWKVHGSLSWFWKELPGASSHQIVRVGKFDKAAHADQELVIYPSKEKYESSRKQPFIAYFDRLHAYLLDGELLFIVTGYSFSDQHINDIVFNCLRQNKRLFCVVFFYRDEEVEALHKITPPLMNLNAFGPTKALAGGALLKWEFHKDAVLKDGEIFDHYYDEAAQQLKLGHFAKLVEFLIAASARPELQLGPKP
jgi:hypothetical protein